jgi:SAM-dependent methyltransferase
MERSRDPEAFTAFERRGWGERIGGYERTFGRLTDQTVAAMLAGARVGRGRRVLDVCTGHGVLAAAALARGGVAFGLDFAEEVVARARRNAPGVDLRQGDAQALPYPEASFDAVVCGYGLMHLSDPARALAEMHRVLVPGGRLAVSAWEQPGPDNGFGLLYGAVREHGRLEVGLPHGPDFFQFGDPERLRAALSATGLIDIEVTAVPQAWRFDAPGDFLEAILQGAVRAKALLEAQDARALATIREAVARGAARFARAGEACHVPMPAFVGSGAKPATRRT